MQGTPSIEIAAGARRRPGRLYVVAGLVGLLLLVIFTALLVMRNQGPTEPKPSEEVVELASSYERLENLGVRGTFPTWSPDGSAMAAYWEKEVHLWDLDEEGVSSLGSLPIADVQGMLWSPDGHTLAVHSIEAFNVLRGPVSYPTIESPWQPNYGYLTPTLTLIDPDAVGVRYSTVISPPAILSPPSEGSPGWNWVESEFRLLGWTDGGRGLVSMWNLAATDEWSGYNRLQFLRLVLYQVWDAQTGKLVKSQTMLGSELSPGFRTTLYEIALSPDGRTIAFAVRDENPRPGLPFEPSLALELWDVTTGQRKHSVPGLKAEYGLDPRKPWRKMEWSPDSATLYVASRDAVKVIDAATGRVMRQLPDVIPPTSTPTTIPTYIPTSVPQVPLMPAPISTGGPVVVAPTPNVPGLPSLVDLFRSFLPRPQPAPAPTIAPDPNYYAPIIGMAVSPAGGLLAVHDLRVIRIWDTSTWTLKTFVEVPGQVPMYATSGYPQGVPPPVIGWSSDGRLLSSLVMMGGSRVSLIDPDTGKVVRTVGRPATQVEWSPYTDVFAIAPEGGAQSGALEIWQAKDAATMQVTPNHGGVP